MKRFVWILAILVTVSTLTACGGKPRGETENQSVTTQENGDKVEALEDRSAYEEIPADNVVALSEEKIPIKTEPEKEVLQAAYYCNNNSSCTNKVSIPTEGIVRLTIKTLTLESGIELGDMVFDIKFTPKLNTHSLLLIANDVSGSGSKDTLAIEPLDIWNRYAQKASFIIRETIESFPISTTLDNPSVVQEKLVQAINNKLLAGDPITVNSISFPNGNLMKNLKVPVPVVTSKK